MNSIDLQFNYPLTADEQSLLAVANAKWDVQNINENGEMISKPTSFGRTWEVLTSCCRKKTPQKELLQRAIDALSARIEKVVQTQSALPDEEKARLTAGVHERFNNHSFYIAKIRLYSGPNEDALLERLRKAYDESESEVDQAPPSEKQAENELQENNIPAVTDDKQVTNEQDAVPAALEKLVEEAVDQLAKNPNKQVSDEIDESNEEMSGEELVQVKQEPESDDDEMNASKSSRYNFRPREKVDYKKEKIIYID